MFIGLLFLKKVAEYNYLKEQFTAMLNVVHSIKYVGIQLLKADGPQCGLHVSKGKKLAIRTIERRRRL